MNISGKRAGEHSHWVLDPEGLRVESDSSLDESLAYGSRIVVGVDGSSEAQAALRYAGGLASVFRSQLDVIFCWDPSTLGTVTALGWDPVKAGRESLALAVQKEFGVDPPVWVSTHLERGPAAEVLVERSRSADMLVLGKKSHHAVTDFFMGSVSERCANMAECPVLILPFESVRTDRQLKASERAIRSSVGAEGR